MCWLTHNTWIITWSCQGFESLQLHCEVHRLRQVNLNRGVENFIQLLPFVRFVSFWRVIRLNRIYLTLDYEVVLHLLLPEVEV